MVHSLVGSFVHWLVVHWLVRSFHTNARYRFFFSFPRHLPEGLKPMDALGMVLEARVVDGVVS